ncbi:MAG: cell division protein FtsH [Candidatus Omnitrophota bacterium]|nr:MAG: cell division protein FtsH [Candidatus Omnitrophota bacterium]
MNKTMKSFLRKLKIFMEDHWLIIVIILVASILIVLSTIGMSKLDSYARISALANMPLWILVMLVSGAITAFIYVSVLFGYMGRMQKSKIKTKDTHKVCFKDVIGIDEAKEEAWEVVRLLIDRTRLQNIGGKLLRGILMVGPPGCGKTYLAKAIATEAGLPFLSIAGSEFTEMFVGVGASRVRKIFKKARRYAYSDGGCIIFIDEIDAVGRVRAFSWGGGQETNNTLNQLLVEMDGLQGEEGDVIIIAATNADEGVLDQALLRPGRFDRKIYIDRPNLEGREQILNYYFSKVKRDENLDISRLARKAVYKTPAEIENIVKESALIAARNKKEVIGHKEVSEAMERIELGIKHRRKMTVHEREMTAYHEAGHLIVLYILHPTDDVFKTSIISRRNSLGVVHHQPREEIFTNDQNRLMANVKVALGGYVAEKIRFNVTSDGVASDFKQAMRIAHAMVWQFGMGNSDHIGDYTVIPETEISEAIKQNLNEATNQILQKCLKEVTDLLTKERKILDRFAKELLEKEELEYDQIEVIFKEYGK